MSVLVNKDSKIIVQGFTGSEGPGRNFGKVPKAYVQVIE